MRTASQGFLSARFASVCAGVALASACIATPPEGIRRQTDGEGGGFDFEPDPQTSSSSSGGLPDADPHALLGAAPTHGPFNGGQRVLLHGNGFSSKVRVWFGDVEVDPSAIVPVDPGRVQVTAPPGKAGPVELTTQNGDDASTRRSLPGGYVYDALYASPSSGPVAGGTSIELIGQGTRWDATTVASIDQKPCTSLAVEEPTRLRCTVPQGTAGAKTISVTTGDETILVLDGYTYEDSENGYKGGLSGDPLAGRLEVLVYNNFTGDPIPGARVVVGSSLSSALTGEADASGVAVFEDDALDAPRTVTVAATCHSPISFVDVPVDTVTVYLDPVLTPACGAAGDPPPPVGGKVGSAGLLDGEIVWPESTDTGTAATWSNIPSPQRATERRVAYVFTLGSDPLATFRLPSQAQAILPETPGQLGHAFSMYLAPGNRSVYALAGIEDRSMTPPRFTAYAMGIVRGIPVLPNQVTGDVFVQIDQPLDHALSMDVTAPARGAKGPDRIQANVSIMVGNDGFITLPVGAQSPLIPFDGQLTFVGVPPLDKDLFGSRYHSSARAVTGEAGLAPLSVVGRVLSTTTSEAARIGDFVGVPTLETPALNGAWDGAHLATSFSAGAPVDLSVYDIASGNGLLRWTVAVPAGSHAIELPDIRQLGVDNGALPPGPITIGVYGARIDGFDYGKLVYRQLKAQGMTAYSLDSFSAHL
ncbi:IPT/TIG domain-containing protein [Sorangium cellulosum]|uniref:IPT/TIG domain-containing protein n=1 Tax=Sorangium cellulosum TaxID=56 RepID=UPI000CF49CDA|nr:IPT/TIG domain-containing protein [Sorangium cellulosum]